MREIQFRGKDKKTGTWVYGDLLFNGGSPIIVDRKNGVRTDVDPDTVGEQAPVYPSTDGSLIFEGDIVKYWNGHPYSTMNRPEGFIGTAEINCGEWTANNDKLQKSYSLFAEVGNWEVIGNRWDNSDLLIN